jgi:hypothetical protein
MEHKVHYDNHKNHTCHLLHVMIMVVVTRFLIVTKAYNRWHIEPCIRAFICCIIGKLRVGARGDGCGHGRFFFFFFFFFPVCSSTSGQLTSWAFWGVLSCCVIKRR